MSSPVVPRRKSVTQLAVRLSQAPLVSWHDLINTTCRYNLTVGPEGVQLWTAGNPAFPVYTFTPLQYWLFTPQLQWQSRGKLQIVSYRGINGKRWA